MILREIKDVVDALTPDVGVPAEITATVRKREAVGARGKPVFDVDVVVRWE
jgi:hypothetical protein